MAKTKSEIVYAAFGLAILNYVVPTAATAGLLTVIAYTIDGATAESTLDVRMAFGWFAAVLFVVSTGHSEKHSDTKNWVGIPFDLLESLFMVGAFHSLGLVMGVVPESNRCFFLWLSLYLVTILARRLVLTMLKDPEAKQLAKAKADKAIIILSVVVTVLSMSMFVFFDGLRTWCASVERIAAIVLVVSLLIYAFLAIVRERQMPET